MVLKVLLFVLALNILVLLFVKKGLLLLEVNILFGVLLFMVDLMRENISLLLLEEVFIVLLVFVLKGL